MPYLLALFFAVQFLSCGKHDGLDENPDLVRVTFYNESSYSVTIYQDHFDGYILAEKLASGMSHTAKLSPSDNHGNGSVFCIEYWFMVANGAEISGGDVWTGGLVDPNAQITQNIESNKSYSILISNPKKWESKDPEAFIKIVNKSNTPIQFNHLGLFFRLGGNLEFAVPGNKIGFYRVLIDRGESSVEITGRTITQVFETYNFPDFTAVDGHIYTFEFNGKEVKKTGDKKL